MRSPGEWSRTVSVGPDASRHGPGGSGVITPIGDLTAVAAERWPGSINVLSAEVMSPSSPIQRGIGAVETTPAARHA